MKGQLCRVIYTPKLLLTIFHVQRYMSNYREYEKEQKEMAPFFRKKRELLCEIKFYDFFPKAEKSTK